MKKEIAFVVILVAIIIYFGLSHTKKEPEPEIAPVATQQPAEKKSKLDKFIRQPEKKNAAGKTEGRLNSASSENKMFPPSMVTDEPNFPDRVPPEHQTTVPPSTNRQGEKSLPVAKIPKLVTTPPDNLIGFGDEVDTEEDEIVEEETVEVYIDPETGEEIPLDLLEGAEEVQEEPFLDDSEEIYEE